MFETIQMAFDSLLALAARGGPFLVDGRVARSGVTAISAETGTGKSVYCLGVAMGLAAGQSRIHGREVWSPRPRNVLYVDAENQPDAAATRVIAWMLEEGLRELPRLVYHRNPEMQLGRGRNDDRPKEAHPGQALAAGRDVLRERLGDPEAEFDAIFLDNLMSLQNVEDSNSPAQAHQAVKDALKMAEGAGGLPVVLAVHPSQAGGVVNQALLRQGRRPEIGPAISGAMTTANACEAIVCLAKDAGDDNRMLLGTAKMRSARRDEEVYETEIISVDVDLPAWTDDDGTEHPPRVQAGVPVLGDSWRVHGKTSSAASELVEWMVESGLAGKEAARPLLEVVDLAGCPVKERTMRAYVKGESTSAKTAAALGFRHALADKSGRGQVPLLIWIATAEEMESESFEPALRELDADAKCGRCGEHPASHAEDCELGARTGALDRLRGVKTAKAGENSEG